MATYNSGVFAQMMLMGIVIALSGCDKIANTSRAAQSVSMRAFNDTKSSWRDFFTYHPPVPEPMPQTRYCYQMQSDIVCYDSEQPRLTAKLLGYQDGDKLSWVQPGGGALGVSGGEPVALRPLSAQAFNMQTMSTGDSATHTGAVVDTTSAGSLVTDVPKTGQISVGNLPATATPPATATSRRIPR